VKVDRGQIELVLLNLVVNARDAMPGGGTITIETAEVVLNPDDIPARKISGLAGRAIMLAVSDTGVGMTEEIRAHIFEPFFTTKEPGKGTGLGLPTSYGLIRQHGGDIWVYSEPGVGTTFKVYLPVARPSPDDPATTAPELASKGGTETILLVEDDHAVAGVMREALERRGYRLLTASGPDEALAIAATQEATIHLLLTDVVLQTGHGVEVARQIRELRPGIRTLYVSGYTGPATSGKHLLEPDARFLPKPFAPETLAAKVREVLDET
jgi:two-component system, cell cycle sensor histidine kinase and response regulator CckA